MDSLKARLTTRQFDDWCCYFAVEPSGAPLIDAHFARLEYFLANQWAKRAKGKVDDWRFHAGTGAEETKRQRLSRVAATFRGISQAQAAKG